MLEGLLLKHAAHQWTRPATVKTEQAARSSSAPTKTTATATKTKRKTSSAAHR